MTNARTITILLSAGLLLAACGTKKGTPPSGIPTQNMSSSATTTSSGSEQIESKKSLEARAKKGERDAQFELGAIYHDGDGVPKDMKKAREWFEKAATQGETRAEFNLGVMYYTGEGVQKSFALAQKWFQKAVDQGNSRAEFNLGVMFYRGEGVKVDFVKAHELFTASALQNFAEAEFNLGVMEAKGEGKEADIGKAYAWFVLARDNGNPKADDVIKKIEGQLQPDQMKIVQKLAADLKAEVEKNVKSAMTSSAAAR